MEVESKYTTDSKILIKFLDSFSCFNCREIGNIPYILICNHIYCENCVLNNKIKKPDGSFECPFCYMTTKKSELLPELEIRALMCDLKSIDDEEFEIKYKNKIGFIRDSCKKNKNNLRNILSFLINLNLYKKKKRNNNEKKIINKRTYLEFKKETFLPNIENIYEATFPGKPILKYN